MGMVGDRGHPAHEAPLGVLLALPDIRSGEHQGQRAGLLAPRNADVGMEREAPQQLQHVDATEETGPWGALRGKLYPKFKVVSKFQSCIQNSKLYPKFKVVSKIQSCIQNSRLFQGGYTRLFSSLRFSRLYCGFQGLYAPCYFIEAEN